MNKLQKVLVVMAVAGMASVASAHTMFDLEWNGTYSMSSGTPAPTGAFSPIGGGLGIEFAGQHVGFGLKARYLTDTYTQGGSQSPAFIEGAPTFNIYLGRIFELGLGGYFNYVLTKANISSTFDYGALGRLQFNIPLGASAAIILGGEYHFALAAMNVSGGTNTAHMIVGFAGIRFGGGKM